MRPLRHYLIALQFFTRIPVTGALAQWVGFSPAMLRASAAHFPGVGALLGLLCSAVYLTACLWLPSAGSATLVAALLCTAAGVLLTGAFHEDGLADLADGLGGSLQRDRALEIMKDSRIGSFGAIALCLALLGKVSLLALLGQVSLAVAGGAIVLAHVASRTWPLLTIRLLPHVGDAAGSKSKPLADQITLASLAAGGLWCALGLLAVLQLPGAMPAHWLGGASSAERAGEVLLWGLAGSALGWAVVHWRLSVRLQGFTGDGLGAQQQIAEIGCYLACALALGHPPWN